MSLKADPADKSPVLVDLKRFYATDVSKRLDERILEGIYKISGEIELIKEKENPKNHIFSNYLNDFFNAFESAAIPIAELLVKKNDGNLTTDQRMMLIVNTDELHASLTSLARSVPPVPDWVSRLIQLSPIDQLSE